MNKDNLIVHIEEQYKEQNDVLVTLKEFFNERKESWCFAANCCTENFTATEFYKMFKKLESKKEVQDILIEIYDYDDPEEGPYSEMAIVITSLTKLDINIFFGEQQPSEIVELDQNDTRVNLLPKPEENMKVFSLWWD